MEGCWEPWGGEEVDTRVVAADENTVEAEVLGEEITAVVAKPVKAGSMAEGNRDIID